MALLLLLLIVAGWACGFVLAVAAVLHPRRPLERVAGWVFGAALLTTFVVGALG